jgi:hypothetical protein
MRKVLSEKEVIKIIEEKLPELIEKYPLLRLKIEEIIERKAVTKEEIKEILIELRKQREENSKRFEEMDRRFEALINELKAHKEETAKRFEEINKRFEAVDKRFEEINKRFEAVDRRFEELTKEMNKGFELLRNAITALGARWGIFAEEAFREGMKGVIENLGFPSYEIKKWKTFDEEGYVFGYPHEVEVDIVIKDDKHFLIEIKSSVSDADVLKFKKIGELYEKKTGVKPQLIIISPYIREEGKKECEFLGIKYYEKEG